MQPETGRLRVVAAGSSGSTADAANDPSAPSAGSPPSPGEWIRDQRQRRGMSIEQLAVATKIPRASLQLLEEDRYGELPGPVFVKGFLRCAARSLGVNPEQVMELFYERERAALQARRRERPISGPHEQATPVVRRLPPRVRQRPPEESPVRQLLDRLPSPTLFLWIVVAVFVAMVVLAAFNLMGGATGSGPT